MKRSFLERMERYAIVGGPAWLRATLNSLGPLFRVETRHFVAEQEDEAWTWIGAKPVYVRTLFD